MHADRVSDAGALLFPGDPDRVAIFDYFGPDHPGDRLGKILRLSGIEIAYQLLPPQRGIIDDQLLPVVTVQFRHGDLALLVHQILLDTGLPPSRLEIEITESVLIDDFSRAIGILRRLKAMGVRIAMDDFGTGYSSLSYLQAFPFDKLKIDRSFVRDVATDRSAQAIVHAMATLGNRLGMAVTAEGVESMEQLQAVRDMGCTEAQGYLISTPRPASELPTIVRKGLRLVSVAQTRS